MKRRWSVLFWSALAALIGLSWLAKSFGVLVTELGVSLFGMVAATAIAFLAMVKGFRQKWPAATVLVCAAPMALQVFRLLPDIALIIRYFGPPFAVIILGTIATVASAVAILTMLPPKPPQPPPVAPARVVE